MMRYNPSKIEKKWQIRWLKEGTYEPDLKRARKPFYNLMMFPYPSAEGLHIGAMRTFSGVDIYGRLKRMQGRDVFEPIGLDGFGIHSENYALKAGKHPMQHAKDSEKNFYRQLAMMGNGFAWRERLETYDPDYYRWTQWIFIQMFKRGLAYRKKQAVNWCPSCKTVLADEQVITGKCERCSSDVIKKELEQWFFKITDYTERLLKNLDTLDWSERVKVAQREWIGKSEGVSFRYKVKEMDIHFEMFDSVPQTFMAQTFTVVAPEHPQLYQLVRGTEYEKPVMDFVERIKKKRAAKKFDAEKGAEGIFTGRYIEYTPTGKNIPIWVASFVIADYGTGVVNASAHDERDFAFAKKYDIPLHPVMFPKDPLLAQKVRNLEFCYHHAPEGVLQEPADFKGMEWGKAREKIIEYIERKGFGKKATQYHLRDWLISRQRYWAPPIPMIYCETCAAAQKGERPDMPGWYAAPGKTLPVKLPFIKNFRPTGTDQSPLAGVAAFYRVKCPGCNAWARRETDVSDTFLDSAWYHLRYPSVKEKKQPWNPAITKKWLPVSRYIGGAEHSVLHLLYVRFLAMALHDAGLVHFDEPMPSFRAHGLITKDGAKMSKSKGNVVNPDEYVRVFGADAIRMYLAFMAPFEQSGDFRDSGIKGLTRFLERVWKIVNAKCKMLEDRRFSSGSPEPEASGRWQNAKVQGKVENGRIKKSIHKTIKKVTEDIESLHYNTAISALMMLLNEFEQNPERLEAEDKKVFLKLLAPFAPHITEELWQQLSPKSYKLKAVSFHSIHLEKWPVFDPRLVKEDTTTVVLQVNGRVRDQIVVERGAAKTLLEKAALASPKIQGWVKGGKPSKIIVVPDRLVNIVV